MRYAKENILGGLGYRVDEVAMHFRQFVLPDDNLIPFPYIC